MSSRDRTTVFWIRYARWCRGTSPVSTWPEYRELLMRQAEWLIRHGRDRNGAISNALVKLSAVEAVALGEDIKFIQDTLF